MAIILVNITGNPAEHASSIKFTENARRIIPINAKIKLFSDNIFLILSTIFLLFFASVTLHPISFFLSLKYDLKLIIPPTSATIAITYLNHVSIRLDATLRYASINIR